MLVNCAAYQNGKKLGDIRKEEIHDYLAKAGAFVWVALKDPTPEELAEMVREAEQRSRDQLDALVRESGIVGELQIAHVRAQVSISIPLHFENYSDFKPGEQQLADAQTMLDQLSLWTTALKTVRK